MKTLKFLFIIALVSFTANVSAQTADEIITTYFENVGGLDKLKKVEGVKIYAKINLLAYKTR